MPRLLRTFVPFLLLGLALSMGAVDRAARAADDETRFDLEQAWFTNPTGRGYQREFEAALDGYCSALLALIRPVELDWNLDIGPRSGIQTLMRYWAAVRMFDGGVCVEPDPALGTRFFKRLADRDVGFLGIAEMELGWRAWHGVGMDQDREAARRYFEIGTINRLASIWDQADRSWGYDETHTRTGMSLPAYALELLKWFQEFGRTPRDRLDFARDLYEGRVVFPDGRTVSADPRAIDRLVADMPYHQEANFLRGLVHREIERRRSKIGADRRKGGQAEAPRLSLMYMTNAARCNHREATETLVEWLYPGLGDGTVSPHRMITALLRLNELGYDAEDAIQEIERRFPDRALDRADAFRAMLHFTKTKDECESVLPYSENFNHR